MATATTRRGASRPWLAGLCLGAWLVAAGGGQLGWAQESILRDRTVPEAAEQSPGVLERAFEDRRRESPFFPRVQDFLQTRPPFLRDTELVAHFRTYYLDRHNLNGSENQAWAAGGWLQYRSGWLLDTFQLGATLYTSQPLYAPEDKDGTGLLAPGQEGYTVLGEAYAALRYGDHRLTGYRQLLDLPYVNGDDSRMTPNTFEGATLFGKIAWLRYGVGYLTTMKKKNADEFISMGETAGVSGGDQGLAFALVRAGPWKGFSIGATNHFVNDVINIAYAEADYRWRLGPDLAVTFGVQFTDQRSVGSDLLTGSAFDTQAGGARVALRYAGAILTVAFSTTSSGANIQKPFGGYPGYLSLMESDFDRAGEDAWLVGVAYDFGRLGLRGLSAFVNFAQGTGARDPSTGQPLANEREFDLTVDYRVTERGWLQGLWLRLRGAILESGGNTQTEVRLILNYAFPVL
jgi:hypothetical protein